MTEGEGRSVVRTLGLETTNTPAFSPQSSDIADASFSLVGADDDPECTSQIANGPTK